MWLEKTGGGKKKRRRRKKKGEKSASSKEEEEEKIQSPLKKLRPPLLCLEGVAHFCFPFLFFLSRWAILKDGVGPMAHLWSFFVLNHIGTTKEEEQEHLLLESLVFMPFATFIVYDSPIMYLEEI